MSIKLDRRRLMATMGTALALGYLTKRQLWDTLGHRRYPGKVYGANFKRGHHLIKKDLPVSSTDEIETLDFAIVGAGVSGLSCAYTLKKKYPNARFKVFELEDNIGGKAQSFKGVAPWGAHYLPLPNESNKDLLNFLREANILSGEYSSPGENEGYNPFMLLNAPKERLYLFGRFQDGLIPKAGLTELEKREFVDFFNLTTKLTYKRDATGAFAFDIPMEKSSQDKKYIELDSMTMLDFLKSKNLKSEPLYWYVDYCCRDDYGTPLDQISAWAGLHYFCARRPYIPGKEARNLEEETVLTWPEGNNFLIKKLTELSQTHPVTGHLLHQIKGDHLHFFDFHQKKPKTVKANKTVLALPQFIIAKILGNQTKYEYSPWLVANIRIKWDEEISTLLAWDNVNYKGKGLGFIVAKHQTLESMPRENIITYYRPLTHLPPKQARQFALKRTHNQWSQDILSDLQHMIFDLDKRVLEIDIWPWGHAMVSPTKNFMHQTRKENILSPNDNLYFAHSDLSGLSLFEEAFYRGTSAAKEIIKDLA